MEKIKFNKEIRVKANIEAIMKASESLEHLAGRWDLGLKIELSEPFDYIPIQSEKIKLNEKEVMPPSFEFNY